MYITHPQLLVSEFVALKHLPLHRKYPELQLMPHNPDTQVEKPFGVPGHTLPQDLQSMETKKEYGQEAGEGMRKVCVTRSCSCQNSRCSSNCRGTKRNQYRSH